MLRQELEKMIVPFGRVPDLTAIHYREEPLRSNDTSNITLSLTSQMQLRSQTQCAGIKQKRILFHVLKPEASVEPCFGKQILKINMNK